MSDAGELGIERLDQLVQLCVRRDGIDLGEETISRRQLLLDSIFEVTKTPLHNRSGSGWHATIASGMACD